MREQGTLNKETGEGEGRESRAAFFRGPGGPLMSVVEADRRTCKFRESGFGLGLSWACWSSRGMMFDVLLLEKFSFYLTFRNV